MGAQAPRLAASAANSSEVRVREGVQPWVRGKEEPRGKDQQERQEGRRAPTCPGPPAAPRLGLGLGALSTGLSRSVLLPLTKRSGSGCSLRQINSVCFSTSITFRLALGPFEFPWDGKSLLGPKTSAPHQSVTVKPWTLDSCPPTEC